MNEKIVRHVANGAAEDLMDALNLLTSVRGQLPPNCLEPHQPISELERKIRDGLKMIDLLLP